MADYAVYKNRIYKLKLLSDRMEIFTRSKDALNDGFKEFKFNQGFISEVIYKKEVTANQLDMICELNFKVVYKRYEFEVVTDLTAVDNEKIIIYTREPAIADQYDLKKKEQFVYEKDITWTEVEALIVFKKTKEIFQDENEETIRIEPENIKEFLKTLR